MIIEPLRLPEDETRDDKLIAVALNSGSASLASCNRVTHIERRVLRNEVPPSEERERPSRAVPHAYIIQRRLELAKSPIRSGVGLAEAGCEAGFADQNHFHRTFREAAGMTPSEFRARALAVSEIG